MSATALSLPQNVLSTPLPDAVDIVALPRPARLYWKAIVRTGASFGPGRNDDRLEWHLAECQHPSEAGSHCPSGHELASTLGHPDGHCLVNGLCPRCEGRV